LIISSIGALACKYQRIPRTEEKPWKRGVQSKRFVLWALDTRFVHEEGKRGWVVDFNVSK